MDAVSFVVASGYANGVPWSRNAGEPMSCGYSNVPSGGGCSYTSNGTLTEKTSTGSWAWYGTGNLFSAVLASSGDDKGLHADIAVSRTNFPLDHVSNQNNYGSSYSEMYSVTVYRWDTWTIQGPAGFVNVAVNLDLDGTVTRSGAGGAYAEVTLNYWSGGNRVALDQYIYTSGSQTLSATLRDIAVGEGFNYTLQLKAYAGVGESIKAGDAPRLSSGSAEANFSNTLQFSSIGFQDSLGAPLAGYTLQSASGYNYDQFLNAPEPATFIPAGCGILLALALRRRLLQRKSVSRTLPDR